MRLSQPVPQLRAPVPRPRDAFFGRDTLLGEIEELLRGGARLVTLLGPGGIGKTRTAIELAARISDDARERGDGVFFCDLSNVRNADEIVDALSRALGLNLRGPQANDAAEDALEEAGRALAHAGRVLVVIDNFEQLVTPGAEMLDRLLDLAPETRFVVTSRRRLRIRDENAIEVDALSVPGEGDSSEHCGGFANKLCTGGRHCIRNGGSNGYCATDDEKACICASHPNADGC